MDYIELIKEVRAELPRVVNQRCDDMIRMYQNGEPYNRSEIRSRQCRLGRTFPSMLKGKRLVSVTFASGETAEDLYFEAKFDTEELLTMREKNV